MTKTPVMVSVFVPWLSRLLFLVSLWIYYRGHHEPGGGFVGGLVAGLASVLLATAIGPTNAERKMPLRSAERCAILGVSIAILSGLPAFVFGREFLTHPWTKLSFGFIDLDLSTVMLFDLGVYFCVFAAAGGYGIALLKIQDDAEGD